MGKKVQIKSSLGCTEYSEIMNESGMCRMTRYYPEGCTVASAFSYNVIEIRDITKKAEWERILRRTQYGCGFLSCNGVFNPKFRKRELDLEIAKGNVDLVNHDELAEILGEDNFYWII